MLEIRVRLHIPLVKRKRRKNVLAVGFSSVKKCLTATGVGNLASYLVYVRFVVSSMNVLLHL